MRWFGKKNSAPVKARFSLPRWIKARFDAAQTTKDNDEPYRMMTSRAEHRLYLRQDNADLRLTERAHKIGLASDERMRRMEEKARQTEELLHRLQEEGMVREVRRPENRLTLPEGWDYSEAAREQAEITLKYEGYLEKEMTQIRKAREAEEHLIPPGLDWEHIDNLRLEARQKLAKQKPRSIGQAGRIPGVSPADIAVLIVYLRKYAVEHPV